MVLEALRRCRAMMEEEGAGSVQIGLETMGKKGSWGTLEEIEDVVGQMQGVVPVLDFAHLHARGGGSLKQARDFQRVLEEATAFHKGRLHCHFSCIEFTEQGERRHLPLEAKQPDYRYLVRPLRKVGSEVTLISETPPPEDGARDMLAMLLSRK
jgi:deoxyribonuclease-4